MKTYRIKNSSTEVYKLERKIGPFWSYQFFFTKKNGRTLTESAKEKLKELRIEDIVISEFKY